MADEDKKRKPEKEYDRWYDHGIGRIIAYPFIAVAAFVGLLFWKD